MNNYDTKGICQLNEVNDLGLIAEGVVDETQKNFVRNNVKGSVGS